MVLQALRGGFRAGHCAIEIHLVARQRVDEEVGGGAGADADHAAALEAGKNVIDSGLGHGLLELILGHREGAWGEEREGADYTLKSAAGVEPAGAHRAPDEAEE